MIPLKGLDFYQVCDTVVECHRVFDIQIPIENLTASTIAVVDRAYLDRSLACSVPHVPVGILRKEKSGAYYSDGEFTEVNLH